jgi:hypothetical protein
MLGDIDYEFNTQQSTSMLDQDVSKRMEAELKLTELDAGTTKHCGYSYLGRSYIIMHHGSGAYQWAHDRSLLFTLPLLTMSDVSVLNVHSPTRSVLMLSTFVA